MTKVVDYKRRKIAAEKVRVFQWNILADGLGDDGFFSTEFEPIHETKKTGCSSHTASDLMKLIRKAKQEDRENGVIDKLNEVKSIKLKLKNRDDLSDPSKYERMLSKLEDEIQKSSKLIHLKNQFKDSPELKQVDDEILSWSKRYERLKSIVLAADPDIITFQEMDHLHQFINDEEFGKKYTCYVGDNDKNNTSNDYYNPAKYYDDKKKDELRSENYLTKLIESKVSFAPKSYSHAANFRNKRIKKTNDDNDKKTVVDDDGVAIFWKKDKFKAIELGFLKFPSSKKSEAVIAVVLENIKTEKRINVLTTHLPSGDEKKKEKERLDVLENYDETWDAKRIFRTSFGWRKCNYGDFAQQFNGILSFVAHYVKRELYDSSTTIFALDANSRPLFPLVAVDGGSKRTNTWNSIHQGIPNLDSVWVQSGKLLATGESTSSSKFPASVNKMRGPSSNQPNKIGEHQCELIDHIFTNGQESQLIEDIKGQKMAPILYESREGKAELELNPTQKIPSDHFPVVVDITLSGLVTESEYQSVDRLMELLRNQEERISRLENEAEVEGITNGETWC